MVQQTLVVAAVLVAAGGGAARADAYEALIVNSGDLKPYQDLIRGFTDTCNCEVEEAALPVDEAAKESLQRSSTVVLAVGTTAFRRARELAPNPVVYAMVMPSETAVPRKYVSGVSMDVAPSLFLSHIADMLPQARRVGVLFDPRYTERYVNDAKKVAAGMGITLVIREVSDASDVTDALRDMRGAVDALWMLPDPVIVSPGAVDILLRYSFRQGVPVFTFSRKYVEMGAVASLESDPYDMGVQAAELARAIAGGSTEASCVYARKALLTVNRKVAEKMGLRLGGQGRRKSTNAS